MLPVGYNALQIGLRIGKQIDPAIVDERNSTYDAICQLANNYGYDIRQHNGQRFFGPPLFGVVIPPPKECEVFLGGIPQNIFEDTLVPLLRMVGNLYQLRLMMDFSGSNRGFGFATFMTPDQATNACCLLNNYEIVPDTRLVCIPVQDNNCLYIGGIMNMDPREIIFIIYSRAPDAHQIYVTNADNKRKRHVLVTFRDHRAAALARRSFLTRSFELWGPSHQVICDWKTRHEIPCPFNAVGYFSRIVLPPNPQVIRYNYKDGSVYIKYY